MDKIIKEQILAIRDTGLTNMFDVGVVCKIAYEMDFYELVNYLDKNTGNYINFILKGEE